jgi:3-oxoacyl-[acyl-carrier protein] reductase
MLMEGMPLSADHARDDWNLSGRVCLVTGSLRGIGLAVAKRAAGLGANIALNDILPKEAREVAECLKDAALSRVQVRYYPADVSDALQVETMVKSVLADFGKIDALVNNAGVTGPASPVVELAEAQWDRVLAVDLKGTYLMTRATLPNMISNNYGRIVNISSVAGKEGNPNMAAYCAAKHGVLGFTKAVAREVLEHNIRINAVCPALVKTALLEQLPTKQVELLTRKIPLARLAEPEEVADMVAFLLASRAVNFITGQAFDITGGRADY